MNGLIVIDKPAGMTSHDVVNRVRRITTERSVGHLGTLDPMATGVLPLVLGRWTRLAQFYAASEKSYEGEIRLGFATDTYDSEGEPTTETRDTAQVTLEHLRLIAGNLCGIMYQMPPAYSAKKVGGIAAYKLARNKKEVKLEPVQIEVKKFEIRCLEGDRVQFSARVSSGTYIRSIAHDLGQKLGCGAHLSKLRRTASGEFRDSDTHTLDDIESAADDGRMDSLFIHPRAVLPEMPSVTATEEMAAMIRNGRALNLPEMSRAPRVKVFAGQAELIAIAQRIAGTLFQPKVVFAVGE